MTIQEPNGQITHIPGKWRSAPKRPNWLVRAVGSFLEWIDQDDSDRDITVTEIAIWFAVILGVLIVWKAGSVRAALWSMGVTW